MNILAGRSKLKTFVDTCKNEYDEFDNQIIINSNNSNRKREYMNMMRVTDCRLGNHCQTRSRVQKNKSTNVVRAKEIKNSWGGLSMTEVKITTYVKIWEVRRSARRL